MAPTTRNGGAISKPIRRGLEGNNRRLHIGEDGPENHVDQAAHRRPDIKLHAAIGLQLVVAEERVARPPPAAAKPAGALCRSTDSAAWSTSGATKRTTKAPPIAATTAPPIAAARTGLIRVCCRAIGFSSSLPVTPLPPPANSSGRVDFDLGLFLRDRDLRLAFRTRSRLAGELVVDVETLLAAGTYNQDSHAIARQRGCSSLPSSSFAYPHGMSRKLQLGLNLPAIIVSCKTVS